jgi:hypothetical protein
VVVGDTITFQELVNGFLRADVMGLNGVQIVLGLDAGGDGQKAIEAAGIVGAVFVLRAAIHKASEGRVTFEDATPELDIAA